MDAGPGIWVNTEICFIVDMHIQKSLLFLVINEGLVMSSSCVFKGKHLCKHGGKEIVIILDSRFIFVGSACQKTSTVCVTFTV